ncbi:hypothetical protein HMPREF1983_01521 [Gemella bergeri ATCC 700627]|uniref:Uncharacterized protein n=1 Tax=Gemella bergeri ATCC 700627 TaxID=1321820 RepID=U2QIS5_9BACL|nr:hypothetical protein [Gemella bergeri]ERK56109.1 hypothetical protein HMPREF1983_01521 [Gemella bergeri ATCC 700627]
MNSIIISIVIFVVGLIISNLKKENKKTKFKEVSKSKVKEQRQNKKNLIKSGITIDEKDSMNYNRTIQRQNRVVVDKEKEILSNSSIIDKEKIINDIIFSEILSKPKSKR